MPVKKLIFFSREKREVQNTLCGYDDSRGSRFVTGRKDEFFHFNTQAFVVRKILGGLLFEAELTFPRIIDPTRKVNESYEWRGFNCAVCIGKKR